MAESVLPSQFLLTRQHDSVWKRDRVRTRVRVVPRLREVAVARVLRRLHDFGSGRRGTTLTLVLTLARFHTESCCRVSKN